MSDVSCKYCTRSQELFDIVLPVREFEMSTLYLMKNQTYRGRCILVCKRHATELFQLSAPELRLFTEELCRCARAIKAAFSADKINYAVFGDTVPHLHFHLVPKYKDGPSWGGPFEMDPKPWPALEEKEYREIIDRIEAGL